MPLPMSMRLDWQMLNNVVFYGLAEYLYQMYESDRITWAEYQHAKDDLSAARTLAHEKAKTYELGRG